MASQLSEENNNLFVFNLYIGGYHAYKDVSTPVIGEIPVVENPKI